jgi:hypothetical protein
VKAYTKRSVIENRIEPTNRSTQSQLNFGQGAKRGRKDSFTTNGTGKLNIHPQK